MEGMNIEKYYAYDIIKDILERENISYAELADKLHTSRQALYGLLNPAQEMRVDRFKTMLDILGYEMIIKKKD